MKKAEIQKAIKKLKKCMNRKSTMAILDKILNDNGTMTVSDLEVFFTVKTGFPGKFLIDFKQLEKIVNKLPANAEIEIGVNGDRVELTTDKGAKFGFPSEDVADFPEPTKCEKGIGSFNPEQIGIIKKAVKFVANDDLSPIMNGVFLGDHIVASDAHRLVYYQWDKTLSEEILITDSVVGMINFSDYSVSVSEAGSPVIKLVSENETIIFREIEGKYPNYQSVIPEKSPIHIELNTKDLVDTVKLAMVTANEASHLIKFDFEGNQVEVRSEDLGYETSFSQNVGLKKQNGDINIGMKGSFLLSLLADCGETVTLKMTDPTRCILINDEKLLMPMML